MSQYLAFDLGASNGRLMAGEFDGKRLSLSEIHRFPNEPLKKDGHIYWNMDFIFKEMTAGLRKAASAGIRPKSIGVDTWGVDYGLIDKSGSITGEPVCYRDVRNNGMMEEVSTFIPNEELYRKTGIQFMEFNTVFQLRAEMRMRPQVLNSAHKLLFMPDLFGYLLTGEVFNEYTILSTSQLMNAYEKKPDPDILGRLGIPEGIFSEVVHPGAVIEPIKKPLLEEAGLGGEDVSFVAVGSHDTASAVAGTPFGGGGNTFLSCGTWSLLGSELEEPLINDETYANNFTNEGGVENTIRFLKNINGLWVVQQLQKSWEGQPGFAVIAGEARKERDKEFIIDPSEPAFTAPENMAKEIARYCGEHGQGVPVSLGETAIAVYNGLKREYAVQIGRLEKLTGKKISAVHMVGGGIQDSFLCELTAEATGRNIVTGPVEASVMGNMVMQMKASGDISSLSEGRKIVGASL